ncbi:hypothetical protein C8J56DRAFT_835946 [Mycena floridula]|nr:hypothetical protein C8J56DRAFT_835946 [Mycena floridula]
MSTSDLIFVTGASGFLGSHVVQQLVENGYRVRAAVRASKVEYLRASYSADELEIVVISDIASDQFPSALEGVHAVIHVASPLLQTNDTEEMLKTAVEGTLNIIRQAEKAGIRKIVVTSSIATVMNARGSYKDTDWTSVTREQAKKEKGLTGYRASKLFAEQAVWDFAEAHPHVDFTVLNPTWIYGPFARGFKVPTPNYTAISTNLYIYRLLTSTGQLPPGPNHVDVRDTAKAHVLALKSSRDVGKKRLIISSLYGFNYARFLEIVREKRPELAQRLTKAPLPEKEAEGIPFDVHRLEEVLGFTRSDFTSFEDTVLDTVDDILALEQEWIAKGFKIEVPAM